MAKHELVAGELQGATIRVKGVNAPTANVVLGYYYELTDIDTITESETDKVAPWEKRYRGAHRANNLPSSDILWNNPIMATDKKGPVL